MSDFMDAMRRKSQPAPQASAPSSFMASMRSRAPQTDQPYGPLNPSPATYRTASRLQQMGAMDQSTPIMRQRIAAEERERDGMEEMEIKRNPLISYAAGVNQSLGQVGESLVGLYAPETANRLKQAREIEYGVPHGAAGMAGQAIGMIGNVAATIGTGGALGSVGLAANAARGMAITSSLFAQQGAGRVRQNVAEQRAAGRNISWQAEWSAAMATGAIEGVSGAVSAGVAARMGKMLSAIAPELQGALRFGGHKAAVKKLLGALPGMGIEGTEEALTQLATNGIDMMHDITPGLTIDEGVLEAGLIGAGLAPILGGVSGMGLKARATAVQQGSPAVTGLVPNPNGPDNVGLPEAIEAASPVEDMTGSQAPVRPNGAAYQQTRQMYVDGQNIAALNRADTVIRDVSDGDIEIENALYKAINMAPPVTGESDSSGTIVRLDHMRKTKAKPKTLESNKTVVALAKILRKTDRAKDTEAGDSLVAEMGRDLAIVKNKIQKAQGASEIVILEELQREAAFIRDRIVAIRKRTDEGMSVDAAQTKAEKMITRVAKRLKNSVMEDAAAAKHETLVRRAMAQNKDVPQAVLDEYKPLPIEKTDRAIQTNTQEAWDNDAWGDDEGVTLGDDGLILDTRANNNAPDDPSQSHKWTVGVDPDVENTYAQTDSEGNPVEGTEFVEDAYAILDENGDVIFGPWDTKAEADFELQHIQETNKGAGDFVNDRIDGWDVWEGRKPYDPSQAVQEEPPKPPERADGTPPNADTTGPTPGENSSPALKRRNGNDLITPVSTRIFNISKAVFGKLMRYESGVAWETAKTLRAVKDWGNALHRTFKLHGKERAMGLQQQMHMALGNGRYDVAYQLMLDAAPDRASGRMLVAGMKKIQRLMNQLQARQRDAGIEITKIDNYFPRAVKNHKAYLQALGKEDRSSITKKIEAEEKKLERDLTTEERQQIINDDLQGYGEQFREHSVRHGARRTVQRIDPAMSNMYERYDVALTQYLARTIESIHTAKFFGKGNVEDSIGQYLDREREYGNITEDQQQQLRSLLGSRFIGGQRTPKRWIRVIRDIGYITTLTNPLSAVTQMGDMALSMIENGMIPTLRGAKHAFSPEALRQYDIGVLQATAEFGTVDGLGKYLDFFMTKSGFKFMDSLGKTLNINSSYMLMADAARGQKGTQIIDGKMVQNTEDSAAFTKMEKEWQPILGDDFQQTMMDFRSGEMSDNVRMVLFTKLSRIQPISLSEFPVLYLNHPDGRIFYMLKSFTIKQFDFMKRMSIDKIRAGEYREGMKGLVSILFIYGAMFGIDLLKDFMMQRETNANNIGDKAVATALKVFGTSKYMMTSAMSDGPVAAALGAIAPPTQWLSDPLRDLANVPDFVMGEKSLSEIRSYRNAPLVGKWLYYGIGHGNTTDAKNAKRDRREDRTNVRDEAKKAMLDGELNSARILVAHYNDSKPDDMERISLKSIRNGIKRDRKKVYEDEQGITERREERRLR